MKQLPEDFKNCHTIKIGSNEQLSAPVKEIRNVLDTTQLSQASPEEIFNAIKAAYYKAFADTGFKMVGTDQEIDQNAMYQITEIMKYITPVYGGMRLGEIQIAVNRGIRKVYGDYMGLSVVTFFSFFDGYIKHQDRQNALLDLYRVRNAPGEPTRAEAYDLAKSNALHTLKEVREGRNINYIGAVVYDFLDTLGLIDFDNEEKRAMYQEVRRVAEMEFSSPKIDRTKRLDAVWILEALQDPSKPQENIVNILKWRAKALALKKFLEGVILNDVDLDELIESKKELYL